MLPDERYTDPSPDQLQDAIDVALPICQDQDIDLKDLDTTFRLLVTAIDWQTGVVISATNLPRLTSLSPEHRSWFPSYPWLEALLEEYQYIIILPAWLADLQGAIRGARAAALRSVGRIDPRRLPTLERFRKRASGLGVSQGEARLELMTDTLLQVLTYRHEALTVRSTSNPVQLKQPDGNAELVVPSLFDHWTFRQWVEVQTIENTLLRLEEKPLHLDVLIDVPKDEAEPSQLWWYPGLPPAARGGRPVGSNRFQSEDAVLRWLKPYVHAIWRDSRYPSLSAVAGQIGVHEDTIRHHIERFFPDWESVLKLLRGNFR